MRQDGHPSKSSPAKAFQQFAASVAGDRNSARLLQASLRFQRSYPNRAGETIRLRHLCASVSCSTRLIALLLRRTADMNRVTGAQVGGTSAAEPSFPPSQLGVREPIDDHPMLVELKMAVAGVLRGRLRLDLAKHWARISGLLPTPTLTHVARIPQGEPETTERIHPTCRSSLVARG